VGRQVLSSRESTRSEHEQVNTTSFWPLYDDRRSIYSAAQVRSMFGWYL